MNKEQININDFNLFFDVMKSLSRMSDGAKFSINDCGLTIYAKNDYSKSELTTNSITTSNPTEFCIGDLGMFIKVLNTVKETYKDGGLETVKMFHDAPFIKIESKKFKTKFVTTEENRITNFIGNKVHTELTPQLEFTTNSNMIKNVNGHSFMFNDSSAPRIYLTVDSEMENNVVFATIGNENNDLANSITLELGLINSGSIGERKVILDFNRLNILNMIPSDEIVVKLANERPVLSCEIKKTGQNNTFFNASIYVFMMVK